jgi:threonyl-tRNA synthetase
MKIGLQAILLLSANMTTLAFNVARRSLVQHKTLILPSTRSSSPSALISSHRPLANAFRLFSAVAEADVEVEEDLPTNDSDPNLLKLRHTSAHVMAMAVQRTFPEAQVTIGPWIDDGFYYDFYFPPTDENETGRKLTDADLKLIKKEMDKIISADLPIVREEVTREEARARIEKIGEPFKLEILDSIKTEPITIYSLGEEWWDLCAGPHVESTGQLPKKAIQLRNVAGAYWRGDEKREMLQRIYATAWHTPQQLKAHKKRIEEAKKRDHRVLGTKLDLFSIQENAGGGLVFWHPKGSAVRRKIEDFWKESHIREGYDIVYTPHIANLDLWKTSGHFDFYKEGMFDQMEVENESYQIKPMNCPFHCLMYKDSMRSYRDLPFRWGELGTVYRYERSGTLHGLMRVRGFTQDDAHIFCLPEQLQSEIVDVLKLTQSILSRFGFDKYELMISTRPEKSVGSDQIWEDATAALIGALDELGWKYGTDEGGGAFYGPKIDLKIKDAIGRTWQCSTVQCDFNLPERFDLEYVSAEGTRERPIMVHRAIFGSIERFFGILIENTAGDLPFWLAPTQLRLLPVTDAVFDYCKDVAAKANRLGLRVEVDRGSERLAKQIRNAEQGRIPVMAVVGAKEMEEGSLAVRSRKNGDLGSFKVDELLDELKRCDEAAEEMSKLGEITVNAVATEE